MSLTQTRQNTDLRYLPEFSEWLSQQHASQKTIKNYVSDVRRFLAWLEERFPGMNLTNVQADAADRYLEELALTGTSPNTIQRKRASLRRFGDFWAATYSVTTPVQIRPSAAVQIDNPRTNPVAAWDTLLRRFALALEAEDCKDSTVKNYTIDVGLFAEAHQNLPPYEILTKTRIDAYQRQLRFEGLSNATLSRKSASLRRFADWALKEELIEANPFAGRLEAAKESAEKSVVSVKEAVKTRFAPLALFENKNKTTPGKSDLPAKDLEKIEPSRASRGGFSRLYQAYSATRISSYIHLAILVIFSVAIGLLAYQQFGPQAADPFVYPSDLTRPGRILSFQGRVTDTSGTPISSAVNMEFRLYNDETVGTQLWDSATCSIDPDQDGVFSTLLGDTCGTEIDQNVFSENSEVWLEVQVGSETLTPRQRIASVAYALNAETLQGFPASLDGEINTIPVINALGEVILGANNPSLIASSGAFLIQAESMIFQTEAGSAGDITFAPDAGGTVNILSGTTNQDSLYIANANLTSGNLIHGYVGNDSGTGNLLYLGGGSSETTRLAVSKMGDLFVGRAATISGSLNVDSGTLFVDEVNNRVGIGTSTPSYDLHVTGTSGSYLYQSRAGAQSSIDLGSLAVGSGRVQLYASTGQYFLSRSGSNTLTSGGDFFLGTGGTNQSNPGTTRFTILNTSGNVGIGDSTPDSLFSVGATSQFQVNSSGEIVAIDGVAHTLTDSSGNLAINSNGTAVVVVDDLQVNGGDIGIAADTDLLQLASNTFTINGTTQANGNITTTGTITLPNSNTLTGVANYTQFSGGVSVGGATTYGIANTGSANLNAITAAGTINANGGLITRAGGNLSITTTTSGNITLDSVGNLYFNDVRTGNIPLTVADAAIDANLTQGVIDAINDVYDVAKNNTGLWATTNGALYPKNSTLDLLIGATATSSAQFAVNATNGNVRINQGNLTLGYVGGVATIGTNGDFVFQLDADNNGNNALTVRNSSGNDVVTISETEFISHVPSSFLSPGDVNFAYDILLTNNTASAIRSNAPLTIEAGESFESNDLTLKTYNAGDVVFDAGGGVTLAQAQDWTLASSTTALNLASGLLNLDTTNNRLGVGTTAPTQKLHVEGGGIRLGTTSNTNNVLDTAAQASAPSGNLYWGNRQIIDSTNIGSYGVTSVTGTANQITATPTTGNVVLSLPTDLRAPGTFNATTSIATGAGAGTTRIDASGNLTNIGNITTSGTTGISMSGAGAGLTFSGTGNHVISASGGVLQIGAHTLTGAITGNGNAITGLSQLTVDNLRLDGNTIDTTSGNLTLDSTGGTVAIDDNITTTGTITLPNTNTMTGVANYVQFNNGISVGGGTTYYINSSGNAVVNNLNVNGTTTLGDAAGDTVTVNAAAWTFANDTNFALTGGVNGLSFDTNTLSIDATNDRVGVGTTAPSTRLEVRQPANATDTVSIRRFTDTTPSGTLLRFDDAAGNLQTYFGTYGEFKGQAAYEDYNAYYDTGSWFIRGPNTNPTRIGSDIDQDVELYPQGTGDVLVRAGNVGIGTTAPTQKLHVEGAIRLGATSNVNNVLNTAAAGGAPSGNLYWGNRQIIDSTTIGSYGVTSVTGTANQITASPTTGAVVLSLPTDLRAPGTFNATTSIATGAGAGTTRIDASGNLSNIGTIASTYLTTTTNTVNVAGASTVFQMNGTTIVDASRNLTNIANATINGNTILGDAAGDTVTANAAAWTFANDTNFALTGGVNGLSFDTDTLSIDAANDRVGIGTTNPAAKLQVDVDLSTTKGISIHNTNASFGSNPFEVTNISGTPTFYLSSANNVVSTNGGFSFGNSSPNFASYQGYVKTQNAGRVGLYVAATTGQTADIFQVANNSGIKFNVDANGNVGIGTTAPSQILDVTGAIRLGAAGTNNVLNTAAAGGAPSGILYWGNRELIDSSNIGTYGVTSVTGTANQITASPTTGNVVLSLPTDLRAPGTFNATTSIATGAGAGTTRIDASGNLSNIGTIASTYLTTTTNTVNFGGASTVLQLNGTQIMDASRNLTNIGNISLAGTTGISASGAGAGLTFSGTGNHVISASGGVLQLGAHTLTGAITGNGNAITGLSQLTVDNLRLDGNTIDTTSGNLTLDSTGGTVAIDDNITTTGTITLPNTNTMTGVANYVQFNNGISVGGGTTYYINSSGNAVVNNLNVNGTTTLGDAAGDTVTVNSAAWTFANDTNFALTGGVNGLSFDTNTLSIDATNDRVGIGNIAPASLFSVGSSSQFQVNSSGNIVSIGGVAHSIADSSGSLQITSAADLLLDDSHLSSAVKLANTATSLTAPGGGIIDAINGTYTIVSGLTNYWNRNAGTGVLFPVTLTDDVLFGGNSVGTAKFRIDQGDGSLYIGALQHIIESASVLDYTSTPQDVLKISPNADYLQIASDIIVSGGDIYGPYVSQLAQSPSISLLSNSDVAVHGKLGVGVTVAEMQIHAKVTASGGGLLTKYGSTNTGDYVGNYFGIDTANGYNKGAVLFERKDTYGRGNLHWALDNTADSSNVTLADSLMTLTATGNVGIGTTAPTAKLQVLVPGATVAGPTGTWAARIDNMIDTTTYNGLNVSIRNALQSSKVFEAGVYWNGSETYTPKFTITGEGRVGIGTTDPMHALDVQGKINVSDGVIQRGGSAVGSTSDLGLYSQVGGSWMRFVTNSGPFHWYSDSGGGTTPIMTLTATGNVGIGTTNPKTKLEVYNTSSIKTTILGRGQDQDFNIYTRQDKTANGTGALIGELGLEYGTTQNAAIRFHRGASTTGGYISLTAGAGTEEVKIDENSATFYGDVVFSPKSTGSTTTEGAVYYDSDIDHLMLRAGDAAWHRLAKDMTIYSSSGTIQNGDYLEVAHNQNTLDVVATAWVLAVGGWTEIDGLFSVVSNWGTGTDGDLTPSGAFNMNTNTSNGRSYADGIAYRVNAATATGNSVDRYDANSNFTNGFAAGDEVLLISLQGASGDTTDVGNYEYKRVSSVTASTMTFTENIANSYDGTTAANQKVVVQRVPNYARVILDNTDSITTGDWDALATVPTGAAGYYTGIVAYRALLTSIASGTSINVAQKGFVGANGATHAESTDGKLARGGGGGGTGTGSNTGAGGAGGGAGSGGSGAGGAGGSGYCNGKGGGGGGGGGGSHTVPANSSSTSKLYLGSGATQGAGGGAAGGGGGGDMSCSGTPGGSTGGGGGGAKNNSGTAGDGGGIVLINSKFFTNSGSISAIGGNGTAGSGGANASNTCCAGGAGGGGGGGRGGSGAAGGTVYIRAGASIAGITVAGGAAGAGGAGGARAENQTWNGLGGGQYSVAGSAGGSGAAGGTGFSNVTVPGEYELPNSSLVLNNNSARLYNLNGFAITLKLTIIVKGADLAEWYPTQDNSIESGDVVALDRNMPTSGNYSAPGIAKANGEYDEGALGVISEKAGIELSVGGPGRRLVGLQGRVPIKVSSINGPIRKGDYLTASSIPGVAMRATRPGKVVAQAMTDYDSSDPTDVGKVIGFLGVGYQNPGLNINPEEQTVLAFSPDGALFNSTQLSALASLDPQELALPENEATQSAVLAELNTLSSSAWNSVSAAVINAYQTIAAPTARIGELITSVIRPGSSGSVTIDLGPFSASNSAQLRIMGGADGQETVASIDNAGNASFSGILRAQQVITNDMNTRYLTAQDLAVVNATVSGELTAESLFANSARVNSLEASILAAANATISGTLYADRIEGRLNSTQISDLQERVFALIAQERAQNPGSSVEDLITDDFEEETGLGDLLDEQNDQIASGSGVFLAQGADVELGSVSAVNLNLESTLSVGQNLMFTANTLAFNVDETCGLDTGSEDETGVDPTCNTFFFQPSGQGRLSFLADAMVLSRDGGLVINTDVFVNGRLTASGGVSTSLLAALPGENIEINLAGAPTEAEMLEEFGSGATNVPTIPGSDLIIRGDNGKEVAAFTASGSARLQRLTLVAEAATADSQAIDTSIQTNATTGTATIGAGSTEFLIRNSNITDHSLIYVTPTSDTRNQVVFVKAKISDYLGTPEINEAGFIVSVSQPILDDIDFNWWIVEGVAQAN